MAVRQIRQMRCIHYLTMLFASSMIVSMLVSGIAQRAFAQTVTNAGPFTITASVFQVTSFRINRSVLSEGSLADAIEVDATITNMILSKNVFIPSAGNVSFHLLSTSSRPATFIGLRSHVVAFSSAQGPFQSLDVTPGELLLNSGGILAPDLLNRLRNLTITLTNVRIEATSLIAGSAIIPNILLSVQ